MEGQASYESHIRSLSRTCISTRVCVPFHVFDKISCTYLVKWAIISKTSRLMRDRWAKKREDVRVNFRTFVSNLEQSRRRTIGKQRSNTHVRITDIYFWQWWPRIRDECFELQRKNKYPTLRLRSVSLPLSHIFYTRKIDPNETRKGREKKMYTTKRTDGKRAIDS